MNLNSSLYCVLTSLLLVACDPADGSVSATASSSSGGDEGDLCSLGDDFPEPPFMRLDQFQDEFDLMNAPCVVTAAGFDCDGKTFDVDAMFEPFGPRPWVEGQTVLLTTDAFWFTVSEVAIRSADGELLAVMSWRPDGTVGPISITTAPSGCENADEPRIILLQATYTVAGQSITLAGRREGTLPGFEIYQAKAEDISEISAGEIAESVSFVAIASP